MESGAVRYGKREGGGRRYIWSLRFLSLSLLDGDTVRCGERERTLRFDNLRFLCVRLSQKTVYGLVRREIVRYGLSMRFSAFM